MKQFIIAVFIIVLFIGLMSCKSQRQTCPACIQVQHVEQITDNKSKL